MPWEQEPLRAVRFKAWLADGSTVEGTCPDDWRAIPDWPTAVIGVMLYFDNGTRRVIAGAHWTYMVEFDDGNWTLDGDDNANVLLLKYPRAIFKPSALVSDAAMVRAQAEMMA